MLSNLIKRTLARTMREQLSKLDALHLRHAGEECYIFGDGVSLKWMDLSRFSDRLSIIGNMIVYHRELGALHAPYCTLSQPLYFYPVFPYRGRGRFELVRDRVHEEYFRSMREHPEILFFLNYSNYPTTRSLPNVLYATRWHVPPVANRNPYRDRADAHHGTLRFQLSLALFMGFRRVYLVGHDYTHFPARSLHFYEKGQGVADPIRGFCAEFLAYANQAMEIFTVTLGEGSETARAISYRELTGAEPVYRENVELVDRVKLDNLATSFRYQIF